MEASDKPGPSVEKSDDLDNLLDSALGDFEKPLPKVTTEAATSVDSALKPELNFSTADIPGWGTDEFKKVHDAMQSFLKEDTNFEEEFEQLTGGASSSDFSASLAEAMKAIADNTQCAPDPTSEEFARLFNGLGLANGTAPPGEPMPDFLPFMQTLMQNLLSKEILYPALKDIVGKYPEWLADNRMKLETSDYQNYSKQYDLMKQICEEFEMCEESSEDVQTRQFEKILGLMQKMQECGNPPKELMGDIPSNLPFDEQGNVKPGCGLSEQCNIM